MNIEVNDKGVIELREVFGGITLITGAGEKLHIVMRDSGFEFSYFEEYYLIKEGVIKKQIATNYTNIDSPEKEEIDRIREHLKKIWKLTSIFKCSPDVQLEINKIRQTLRKSELNNLTENES